VIFINAKKLSLILLASVGLSIPGYAKVKQVGKTIQLRPVNIKNVAYASNGKSFAIPNFVTAGSVAIFFVSEQGKWDQFLHVSPSEISCTLPEFSTIILEKNNSHQWLSCLFRSS
jgi:hypothetical protein